MMKKLTLIAAAAVALLAPTGAEANDTPRVASLRDWGYGYGFDLDGKLQESTWVCGNWFFYGRQSRSSASPVSSKHSPELRAARRIPA